MSRLEDDFIEHINNPDEYEGMHPMNKYCLICKAEMVTKEGKHGKFRGCSDFPKCDWTEDYEECGDILDNSIEESEITE